MSIMSDRIKKLREKSGMTQDDMAEKLGMHRANVSNYERGIVTNIPADILHKMANLFNTNVDFIMGRTDDTSPSSSASYYELTQKDERDIAKELEKIMSDLESNSALAFDGEPMDDDDRELLRISLDNSLRLAKQMAKKKFTPKKYRK